MAGERIGMLPPGQQNPTCYHEVWSCVDWAHRALSQCVLFTTLVGVS